MTDCQAEIILTNNQKTRTYLDQIILVPEDIWQQTLKTIDQLMVNRPIYGSLDKSQKIKPLAEKLQAVSRDPSLWQAKKPAQSGLVTFQSSYNRWWQIDHQAPIGVDYFANGWWLNAEQKELKINFQSDKWYQLGRITSIFTWLLLIILLFFQIITSKRKKTSSDNIS